MNIAKITVFRGKRRVNKFDRIKNECEGGSLEITNMVKKMRENICVEMIRTCRKKK